MDKARVAFGILVLMSMALASLTSTATRAQAPEDLALARAELAPTGTLRVGLNPFITRDPVTGDLRGPPVDLGRELAARLGVPFAAVVYPSVAKLTEAAGSNAWDVAFLADDPERAKVMNFAAVYMEVPNTYLVPVNSSIYSIADADQPGVRIAVARNNAPDLFLTRTLQYAALVRGDTNDTALALLTSGRADALAGAQAGHLAIMDSLAGYRMLDDDFLVVPHSLAVQPGRAAGLAYATRFIEAAKAAGLVLRSIEASGLRGVRVAPPTGR